MATAKSARLQNRRSRRAHIPRGPAQIFPPAFTPATLIRKKFRYLCGNDTSDQLISSKDLTQLLTICTVGSPTFSHTTFTSMWRIVGVEAWAIQDVTLQMDWTTISLTWLPTTSGLGAPPLNVSDSGNQVRPAHIKTRPPAASTDRMWNAGWANRAVGPFLISCPAGTVIDLDMEMYLVDRTLDAYVSGPTANALTSASGTAGWLYYNYLDNSSTASAVAGPGNFAPVGGYPAVLSYS